MNLITVLSGRSGLGWPLLLIFFFFPFFAWAQSDTTTAYDYSLFRFPDINRRALDIGGNFDGNAGRFGNSGLISNLQDGIRQDLGGSYSHFVNNAKVQALRSVSFNPSLRWSKHEFPQLFVPEKVRLFEVNANFQTFSYNRFYISPSRFLEAGWDAFGFYGRRDVKSSVDPPQLSENVNYTVRLPLKFGVGRIEPIDDVFRAKFMMDDMFENGVLQVPVLQDDLFELGRVMAYARNQRIFDFRRQRIFELTQLNNWFASKKIVDTGDLLYFTALTDNWLYAFRNTRFSGKRFSIGLTPYRQFSDNNEESPTFTNGINFEALYEKQRPANQFWQLDHTLAFAAGYGRHNRNYFNETLLSWFFLSVTAGAEAGYYPNSRTRMSARAAVTPKYYLNASALQPAGINSQVFDLNAQAGIEMDYLLNFRTRLNAGFSTVYNWSDGPAFFGVPTFSFIPQKLSQFWLSGRLGLIYSMF